MALSDADRFNLEVLKLLLQLAWVDGEVDQREAMLVLGVGRSWSVPEPALQRLKEGIASGKRPGEPDLELLRQRPDEVLEAARALVLSDGRVHPEESALLKGVQARLRG